MPRIAQEARRHRRTAASRARGDAVRASRARAQPAGPERRSGRAHQAARLEAGDDARGGARRATDGTLRQGLASKATTRTTTCRRRTAGGPRLGPHRRVLRRRRHVAQFDHYYELKKAAHAAVERAQDTGERRSGGRGPAQNRLAQREFAALSTGQPQEPWRFHASSTPTASRSGAQRVHCDLALLRAPPETSRRAWRWASPTDCPIALHAHRHSPLATPSPRATR